MNTLRYLFGLILVVACNNLSFASPSLEEYGLLPAFSKMAISPNGEFVAFRRTTADKDMVIIFSLKENKTINALDVSSIDPHQIDFLNDDNLILRVSKFQKLLNYKSAFDISTAYSFQFKKNKIEPLIRPGESITSKLGIHTGQSGLGRILGRSPDHKYVYMPAYISETDYDQAPNYGLLRVRANGKGAPRLMYKGDDDAYDFFMDEQGNLVARALYNNHTNVHRIDKHVGNNWETIYTETLELTTHHFVGLTEDSKNLIFVLQKANEDYNNYYSMSLADGSIKKLAYDREDADIERVLTTINRIVIGVVYSGFSPSYKFFDANIQKRWDEIQNAFPEHSVYFMDASNQYKDILVKVEGSSVAGDFYLFSEGKAPRFVASARPNIKEEDINPIGKMAYSARDGRKIPTLLTIPRNKISDIKNLPTVIMPHGGPASYDRLGFDFMAQALASRGFLVVQPQFRGSEGFGLAHEKAGHGEWGKKMQDDLTDAVNVLTKNGMIDPNRVCIAGASYGGYAALAGATFTPDLYQCAYSLAGVSHLPKMLAYDKSQFGRDSQVLSYFEKIIGGGEFDKQVLRDISPYYHADKVKIPVMLVHGVDDTVVEYEQSQLMYKALKKAGADVEFIKLKHEDHHLQDGETRLQALKAMVSFIEKHIGGNTK